MKKDRSSKNAQQSNDISLSLDPDSSWLELDDATIGIRYWAWFMNFVLGKWGINFIEECKRKSLEQVLADHAELLADLPSAALDLDQDDPEGVLLEKAAKFCAEGKVARAGKLIRGFIEEREDHFRSRSEADTWKSGQKKKSQLRRPSLLGDLIASKVALKPDISEAELLEQLIAAEGNGVIHYVKDGIISWLDKNENVKEIPITGLKDRLSREKKRQQETTVTSPSK